MTEVGRINIPVEVTGVSEAERGLAAASRAYDRQSGKIKRTAGLTSALGNSMREAAAQYSLYSARANRAADSGRRFANTIEQQGASMRRWGMAGARAGIIVGAGFGLAVKSGLKFDQTMSVVRAATNAQGKDFNRLREAALKWGAKSQFSATEVAEAMTELGKAGFKTNQTIDSLPGVLDAAAASGERMADVTSILVDTLEPFHLGAKKAQMVTDGLAWSANATTASIGDMGEAMKYVAPVAYDVGLSFHETNAALVILAKNGIKGSMAGTSLRGVLQSMSAPNKRVSKEMKELGLTFRDAHGNMLPLDQSFENLRKQLKKMSDEKGDKLLARMFGRENISAARTFLSAGAEGFQKFEKASKGSAGEAANFAAVLRDNLGGDLEQLKGSLETAAVKLSDDLVPSLRGAASGAQGAVDSFNQMDEGTRKMASSILGLGAITLTAVSLFGILAGSVMTGVGWIVRSGAAIVSFGGAIVGATAAIGTALGTLTFALAGSSTALAGFGLAMAANPLITGAIAVGVILAAGVAIYQMTSNSDGLRHSAEEAAAAVDKLATASNAIAGNAISEREATIGVTRAEFELAAAKSQTARIGKDIKKGSQEAREARLREREATVALDRAELRLSDAKKKNKKDSKDAVAAGKTNLEVIKDETRLQEQLRATLATKGDNPRSRTNWKALERQLAASEKRADAARRALTNAGKAAQTVGSKAGSAAPQVATLVSQMSKLKSKTVKITVKQYKQIMTSPGATVGIGPPGNAAGGRMRGPGTGTSDSILHWISNDEYVIKADSARKIGYDRLDELNETGEIPGLKKGGKGGGKKHKTSRKEKTAARFAKLQESIQAGQSQLDYALAKAEQTTGVSDDIGVLGRLERNATGEIKKLTHFRSKYHKRMDTTTRGSLASALADATRRRGEYKTRREELEAGTSIAGLDNMGAALGQKEQALDLALAQAEITEGTADDTTAKQALQNFYQGKAAQLQQYLTDHPSLSADQVASIQGDITSSLRSYQQYQQDLNPAADHSAGGAGAMDTFNDNRSGRQSGSGGSGGGGGNVETSGGNTSGVGYVPDPTLHPVFFDGEQINTLDYDTAGAGIKIFGMFGWDDAEDVRLSREERAGQDGEVARELLMGGATIVIRGVVKGTSRADYFTRRRNLKRLLQPSRAEVVLKAPDPTYAGVHSTSYGNSMTGYLRRECRVVSSIKWGQQHGLYGSEFEIELRASDPRRYDDVSQTLETTDVATGGGMTFPLAFPIDFGDSFSGGTVTIDNTGDYEAPFTARINGPVTNPIVEDISGLGQITFDGLTVNSGDYVDIDVQDRTVVHSDGASRFQYVDFAATTWWKLPESTSTIRLRGSSISDPASLQITFRPAHL